MVTITLRDGQQVSISVDRDGNPTASERTTPGDVWEPVPTERILAYSAWHRIVAPWLRTVGVRRITKDPDTGELKEFI